jgi:hypothetical protein
MIKAESCQVAIKQKENQIILGFGKKKNRKTGEMNVNIKYEGKVVSAKKKLLLSRQFSTDWSL